ncbi:hypothetical protein CQA53_10065 [Helicobacter didelphidarum]|uniref:Uncharacterized protein n=1 Tax=Helicobacter didelphidarum TaxID=2040648 RepID=A0A3D8IAB6_9HELI|nr:hypothetical protein [Helicobacter didelphidarum]RDU61471.1 hypothetical protein CQA53_10065 [Helicobacter didelphidarum]
MNKIYGISVICIPNDRLETDEYGEEFYPCMNEEELQRIEKEKDKNTLTNYLLNTLSMIEKYRF